MNSFFGIGFMELFFIAVLALIVLGPERLPGAIRELAKHIRTIRNLSNELTSQFSEELQALDEINPQKILRELTEDPPEEKKKTATKTASTGAAAGKASSTTSKPATSTKPASAAKPAASTNPAAEATNGNGASTAKSENASNTASTAATDSAQDTASTAESTMSNALSDEHAPAAENSILPPELQAADDTESAASAPAPKQQEQPTLVENAPVEASLDNTNGAGVAASDLPEKPEDGA